MMMKASWNALWCSLQAIVMFISSGLNICSEQSYIVRIKINLLHVSTLYCVAAKREGLFKHIFHIVLWWKQFITCRNTYYVAVMRSYIVLVKQPQYFWHLDILICWFLLSFCFGHWQANSSWFSQVLSFSIFLQKYMQCLRCLHKVSRLTVFAGMNVCCFLKWRRSSFHNRWHFFLVSRILLEKARNRKEIWPNLKGYGWNTVHSFSSFLYIPVSFLIFFHNCFTVVWRKNLEWCGLSWTVMRRIM